MRKKDDKERRKRDRTEKEGRKTKMRKEGEKLEKVEGITSMEKKWKKVWERMKNVWWKNERKCIGRMTESMTKE